MEVQEEYRRLTRQATKKISEHVASPKNETPNVVPEPKLELCEEKKPERKRKKRESSKASLRPFRKSRSMNPNDNESTEVKVEDSNGVLKQSSWSSFNDDEDLPPAILTSPAKSSMFRKPSILSQFSIVWSLNCTWVWQVLWFWTSFTGRKRTYKKFDIVWIKRRNDVYRPCFLTSVKKNHVNYKIINETLSHKCTWKAKFQEIISFDDPDKNIELLVSLALKYT